MERKNTDSGKLLLRMKRDRAIRDEETFLDELDKKSHYVKEKGIDTDSCLVYLVKAMEEIDAVELREVINKFGWQLSIEEKEYAFVLTINIKVKTGELNREVYFRINGMVNYYVNLYFCEIINSGLTLCP